MERRFWLAVRDRRLSGFKFRRQASVGPFVVDFLCVQASLIVELDGGQHGGADDQRRTAFLEREGFRVLRFWNNEVTANWESVLVTVDAALKASVAPPSPNPLPPAGEG